MKYGLYLILCVIFSLQLNAQSTTQNRVCEYVYSDWSLCVNGTQSRSMVCVCDGKGTEDLTFCLEQNIVVAAITQPCDSSKIVCKWRWTLWSGCSAPCGGGNVTREEVCMCEGMKASSPDDYCDLSARYGTEVAPCNTFACGKTPSHSKTYWMERANEGDWPIPDGSFNCSLSEPSTLSPKGRKYSKVLLSQDDSGHPQWFYLAKEWIAAKLNLANGATMSQDILGLMKDVERLLEKCDNWTGNDFYFGVSAKEKLGRTNNNIGGLEHVDEQVSRIMNYDLNKQNKQNSNTALYIIVPCVALLVIGFIIGMTTYYIREKNNAIVDRGVFDSQEESSEEPLKQKGDNLSPMVNLENEEKFDHSGDSGSEHV